MLVLENINKSYGNKVILEDINLIIPKGKMVCLLGKNGVGKSTLIKIITGISLQDKGISKISGYSITDNPIDYKLKFGYVSDNYNNFLNLTGLEYLNFICDIYDIEENLAKSNINKLSEYLDIKNDLNQRICKYSKGMKQKIMIIGAIIHMPELLILDEPFNGLDPESVYKVKKILKKFVKEENKTVLFSTHILEVAENLSDIVLILNNKKIISNLDMTKLLKDETFHLEKLFLELTK
ncbi:ATP-binding cassette domain-containing protein [Clostridium perfringens]